MLTSEQVSLCASLIKQFEGCKLTAYQDQGGRWTIGYGSTGPGIGPGLKWSQERADQQLDVDTKRTCERVLELVKVPLTDNQLAALTSFSYNLGIPNLARSGLLKHLNRGDYDLAALEFPKWCHIGNYMDQGLLNRRNREMEIFLGRTAV